MKMEVKSNSAGAMYSKNSIGNTIHEEKVEKTWEFQESQGSVFGKDEAQMDFMEKRSESQGIVEEDNRDESFVLKNIEVAKGILFILIS